MKRKLYMLWYNMMRRCYNKQYYAYKNYGGKGITVCDEWKTLDRFRESVLTVDGFDEVEFLKGNLSLDKDLKDSKVYSVQGCTFITKQENNKYKPNQQTAFIAYSPNGDSYESDNQSEFARTHNLSQKYISMCINNQRKTHKGWKFVIK